MLAHPGLPELLHLLDGLLGGQAQLAGGAVGRQGVGHVVAAQRRDVHHEAAVLGVVQQKAHAVVLLPDGGGVHVGLLAGHAVPDRAHMGGQFRLAQERVIVVQDQRRALGHPVADLQLGLADVLLAAQVADVGQADAGDDAHVRPGAAGQPADLAGVVHAHLDDGVLRPGADLEQGAGQAQLVVLVALGLDGAAQGAEGRGAELLGGGLAHAAGHAHHFGGKLGPVVGAHLHHGLVAVGAEDGLFLGHALHRVVEHHPFRACLQGFGGKVVPVKVFAGESYKHAPGPGLPAVGGHQRDGLLRVDAFGGRQPRQKGSCCDFFHSFLSPFHMFPKWSVLIINGTLRARQVELCGFRPSFTFTRR